jgi:hypothetical protein
MNSTCGYYYNGSTWGLIGTAPTITYTGAAYLTSYTWGFSSVSGSNIIISATENSGQSGQITWKYEVVFGF